MIAVTFALPAESSAFVRQLTNVRREGWIVRGDLPQKTAATTTQVCVLHTGVGSKVAGARLSEFLAKEKPSLLISSGFCGATRDEVVPGTILIATNYSDAQLAPRTQELLPDALSGKIFSADHVVDPALDRYAIGREHGAVAIDMETEIIAQIANEKGIPMLSLRVVSDSPAAPFPAPPRVLFSVAAQRTEFSQLAGYLTRHPSAIVRLARFSRQVALAKIRLADALVKVIPSFAR